MVEYKEGSGCFMLTRAEEFAQNKYVVVRNAIDKDLAMFGAQYSIFDALQNYKAEDGEYAQVPGTHSKYGDPFMETLLLKLNSKVEEVTGLSRHPTYSYYRLYRPGDELKKHTDRGACEISLTINLGYYYNTENKDYSWDIVVDGNKVRTEPGDMVIYRGLEMEHWRDPFDCGEGSWQSQAFLHYVNAEGPFALCKYDGRPMIVFPKNYKNYEIDNFANIVLSEGINKQNFENKVVYVNNR